MRNLDMAATVYRSSHERGASAGKWSLQTCPSVELGLSLGEGRIGVAAETGSRVSAFTTLK